MKKHYNTAFLCLVLLVLAFNAPAEELVHVLQKGETIYGISRKYNVPADALLSFNKIADAGKIQAGQKIRIPDTYTVLKGDTLYGIARKLGIDVNLILSSNSLTRDSLIKAGDVLYVPLATQSTTNSSTTTVSTPTGSGTQVTSTSGTGIKPIEDPRNFETRKVDSTLIWPVQAKSIAYLSGKIFGVSITGMQGEKVTSISSGTVISLGPYRGYGQVVFVQSKSGYMYVYGGLDTSVLKPGQAISFGDELGKLGADSLSGKPLLYFMVYNKDVPVDPAKAPRGY